MLGGKHLFGQQADNAPLDCVYWWPISVTPLPPAPDEGDSRQRRRDPPQTITQSLISRPHCKETALKTSSCIICFLFNTHTFDCTHYFQHKAFSVWSLMFDQDLPVLKIENEKKMWQSLSKRQRTKEIVSCFLFNFVRVCTCDKHRCVVEPLE